MNDWASIYGCIPNLLCMESLMAPSTQVSFAGVMFGFGVLVGMAFMAGIFALTRR